MFRLTPETFKQLSEALAHLAAFVEAEERRVRDVLCGFLDK